MALELPAFLLSLIKSAEAFHGIFTGLRKRKLKLKRERPFGVVRDGVGFYKTLGRLRIDGKERRVREIPEVIDDDFLLFRIIQSTGRAR